MVPGKKKKKQIKKIFAQPIRIQFGRSGLWLVCVDNVPAKNSTKTCFWLANSDMHIMFLLRIYLI